MMNNKPHTVLKKTSLT